MFRGCMTQVGQASLRDQVWRAVSSLENLLKGIMDIEMHYPTRSGTKVKLDAEFLRKRARVRRQT